MNALMDTVQEDQELATFYASYQDARRRLLEKTRSRGFLPPKSFKRGRKGRGKGFKGKSKGLAQRIASSTCRLCGQIGHWKAERRARPASSDANQISTSFVFDLASCLNAIPTASAESQAKPNNALPFLKTRLGQLVGLRKKSVAQALENRRKFRANAIALVTEWSAQEENICFASSGTIGVVDLGASQTVIGDNKQVPELLNNLPK